MASNSARGTTWLVKAHYWLHFREMITEALPVIVSTGGGRRVVCVWRRSYRPSWRCANRIGICKAGRTRYATDCRHQRRTRDSPFNPLKFALAGRRHVQVGFCHRPLPKDIQPCKAARSIGLAPGVSWPLTIGIILCIVIAGVVSDKQPQKTAPALTPVSPEAMEKQALALQDRGEYAAAEDLFRKCVSERQKVLGIEHIDTLAAMNNLANLLHERGNNDEAELLHQQCLEARERTLGPDHPHTLASLNNLALVLKAKGDLASAEPFSRRAWESMRRTAGPEDQDTLYSLNNLANLLSDKGDYAAAEPLYRQLVDSLESKLGPDHPATLAGQGNLANLLLRKGDPWAAGSIYRRCLEVRERVQGRDHPETLLALNNLAAFHSGNRRLYRGRISLPSLPREPAKSARFRPSGYPCHHGKSGARPAKSGQARRSRTVGPHRACPTRTCPWFQTLRHVRQHGHSCRHLARQRR